MRRIPENNLCEACHNQEATIYCNGVYWCDSCMFELNSYVHEYCPPPFRCENCNKMCYGNCTHYLDDHDHHFCSKECVIEYRMCLDPESKNIEQNKGEIL